MPEREPLPEYAGVIDAVRRLAFDRYYDLVFSYSREHYRERVEMAGFSRLGRVLDAGSGYGQWAAALGEVNERVEAVDVHDRMVEIAGEVTRWWGSGDRVGVSKASLPDLSRFEDGSFDGVWCWGVLMFTRPGATLREFARVLRPGGVALLGCVNGRGRWLHKLTAALRPGSFNPAVARVCVDALRRGHGLDAVPNFTSVRDAARRCEAAGLELVVADFDGHIDVTGRSRRRPMFPRRRYGFEENIEFLARRPDRA